MKTTRNAALAAAAVQLLIAGTSRGQASDPLIPVGTLTAFPTLVQTGTHPTLNWSMMYPSKVIGSLSNGNGNNSGTETAAVVNPPGTLIPSQDLFVTVQIIGSGPTSCGNGNSTQPATDLRMSVNGGTYFQLFYGTQANVNPATQLYIKKIKSGQTINFGGRYVIGTGWSPFYTTNSSNLQVVSLVNGDALPISANSSQVTIANYMKPYLDASRKVKIGPLSVLIVMELGQTNHSQPCFDYQDQAILLTFSRTHPNNGHGNNLDGVDSSNPGQGHGGPNGAVDPSGGYDDEIR